VIFLDKMKKLLCKIFGHKWGKWYYAHVLGERWRFCERCGARQDQKADFHGEFQTTRIVVR